MSFISADEIAEIKEKLEADSLEAKAFMHETFLYVLTDHEQNVCGVPVRIVGMRTGPVEEGPFYVDLVIETPVPDFYVYMQNIFVDSMSNMDRKTGKNVGPALCKPEDTDRVMEIVNAPRYSDGLKVVVDNTKE